jgi:hypothetical protein
MSEPAKFTNSDPIDKREQIRSQLEATRSAFNSLLDQLIIEDLNRPSLNPACNSNPMPEISRER